MKILCALYACLAGAPAVFAEQGLSSNGDEAVAAASPQIQANTVSAPSVGFGPLVSMEILPTSAVSRNSPSYEWNLTNTMNGLMGNWVLTDRRTDPRAWYRIEWKKFVWGDMVLSSGFNSWLGTNNPGGAFAGEFGNRLAWCVVVKSTNGIAFAPNQIWFDMFSNPTNFNLAGNLAVNTSDGAPINYKLTLQGLNYGPNGVKGGGDDIWFNNGQPPTGEVHELYYFGVTTSAGPVTSPSEFPAYRSFLTQPGFFLNIRYWLKVGSRTNGFASATLRTGPKLDIRRAAGTVVMRVHGQPDFGYVLEFAPSPAAPRVLWTTLPGVFYSGMEFTTNTVKAQRYFRLRQSFP